MAEQWLSDEETRPCDACGKAHNGVLLYIVDVNIGVVSQDAVRQRAGLGMMFGGRHDVARVMSAYPDGVVRINDDPVLKHRLLICGSCYMEPICIAEVIERRNRVLESDRA